VSFRWGCEHERNAIEAYSSSAKHNHSDLEVVEAGFFIDPERPYLGASPDSVLNCKCCGKGVIEVKCPHCIKEGLPEDNEVPGFCMTKDNDKWTLKRSHPYFYQIQLQMAVCDVTYGDFVVWTKTEYAVERIMRDDDFLNAKISAAKHIFIYGILPELIGKFYTRKPVANSEGIVPTPVPISSAAESSEKIDDDDDPAKLWCYCNQPSFGEMIECSNGKCSIRWFHFDCLRIRSAPKGKWYCPACRKLSKFNKKKS